MYYLRTDSGGGPAITPRRGRDLWAKLKQTVKQTSLADVLSALGAIPAGFRDSTLAKLLKDSRMLYVDIYIILLFCVKIHVHVYIAWFVRDCFCVW